MIPPFAEIRLTLSRNVAKSSRPPRGGSALDYSPSCRGARPAGRNVGAANWHLHPPLPLFEADTNGSISGMMRGCRLDPQPVCHAMAGYVARTGEALA